MKLRITLLIFIATPLGAMEPQPRKRAVQEAVEQETPKAQRVQEETTLGSLPLEMQTKIMNSILNVSGYTNTAKLYKAAENLRNYMMINKAYYDLINTPITVNSIIRELAKRYTTDNDFIAVVLALGTNSASKWLASRVFDALVPDAQGMLVIANNDHAKDFIIRLAEYLRVVFVNNQFDNYFLLTKNFEPSRKAWFLNNLAISFLPMLSYLILNNHIKMFDLLLSVNGIDLNVTDAKGNTPLIIAIQAKNMAAVQKLIERGADLNVLNGEEKTPLMVAVENENEPAVRLLVNNPATDLSAEDLTEDTPLHKAVDLGNKNILNLLLQAGLPMRLDINAHGRNGDTPLIRAVKKEDMYFIDTLLRSGADINEKDQNDETALMYAARNENSRPLMFLIWRGAALNEQDLDGHTALWHARSADMQQNIRILEQAGAHE